MARGGGPDAVAHDEREFELVTGEAVALDTRPTSFVLRAAGAAIDFVAYYALLIGLTIAVGTLAESIRLDEAATAAALLSTTVFAIVVVPTAVELASRGKSLGRLAVGARIVRDDGGAIGFRHAFIRALLGVFEIFMTFGGTAVLVALLNGRAKRLGDLIAGTYSQHERVSAVIPPAYGVPVGLQEWALTADVARMPDPLARRISQFLRNAPALTPASRSRLALDLANEAAPWVSPLPTADPELFLAAVTAIRRDRERRALDLEQRRLESLSPMLSGLPHGFPDR